MIFCDVYVYQKCGEKLDGSWRSFSWLGQKVTDNNTHAQFTPTKKTQ